MLTRRSFVRSAISTAILLPAIAQTPNAPAQFIVVGGGASGSVPGSGGGGGDAEVTPSLLVEYVDSSGNLQRTTVVSGVTSISGTYPFRVHLDATGSRSTATNADTGDEAFHNLGFCFAHGEGIGGTWGVVDLSGLGLGYTGGHRDRDYGPPIAGYCYTTSGTFTSTLYVRDVNGKQNTVTFQVVVAAPGAGTTITAGTSWPSWASNTVYNLNRGSNYTSMGALNFGGQTNIIVRAIGSGADPIVGTVNFDNRGISTSGAMTDSSGIRFEGVDIASIGSSSYHGTKHCGAVGGRARQVHGMVSAALNWSQGGNQTARNNVTYCRGFYLQSTGIMLPNGDYNVIADYSGAYYRAVRFEHNAAEHVVRGMQHECTYRSCLWKATGANTRTYVIMQGSGESGVDPPDAFDYTNFRVGSHALGRPYSMACSKSFTHNCQFGESGHQLPWAYGNAGPENNDVGQFVQGSELSGGEDSVAFKSANPMGTNGLGIDLNGRELFWRNVKMNMGAGAQADDEQGREPNRIPTGWNGPYRVQSTNDRPIAVIA